MLPVTGTGFGAGSPGPAPIIDTGAIATQVPGHQWPHSLQQLIAMARAGQFNGNGFGFNAGQHPGHNLNFRGMREPDGDGMQILPQIPPMPTGDHPPPMALPPPTPGGVIGPRGIHVGPGIRPMPMMQDWRMR